MSDKGRNRKKQPEIISVLEEFLAGYEDCVYDEFMNIRNAGLIEKPSERLLKPPVIVKDFPPVGKYILYNLERRFESCSGHPMWEPRGIALVLGYTKYLLRVQEIRTANYSVETSFSIRSELKTGMFKYKILDDAVCKRNGRAFSYQELDISNPHELIMQHIVSEEK